MCVFAWSISGVYSACVVLCVWCMCFDRCNQLSFSTNRPLQDRSLLGRDPVIWYTFAFTHFVRPEDYPVMPCDTTGFR